MNRLREIRKAKGISQAQLFGMTKIWPSSIGFIERNFWDPSFDVKRRLAKALRVRVADLFPDDGSIRAKNNMIDKKFNRGKTNGKQTRGSL